MTDGDDGARDGPPTTESDRPADSTDKGSSTNDGPSTSASDEPSASANEDLSTSASDTPSTSASDDPSTNDGDGSASEPPRNRLGRSDLWQIGLVALVASVLVLAAFVAPPAGPAGPSVEDPDRTIEPDDSPPPEESEEGDGFEWPGVLEWILSLFERSEPPESVCTILLDRDPVPGAAVTVGVGHDGDPVTGAAVWFNDDFIGQTGDDGTVTGSVPYEAELEIRVELGDRPDCVVDAHALSGTATRSDVGGAASSLATTTPSVATTIGPPTGSESVASVDRRTQADRPDTVASAAETAADGSNASASFDVEGEVEIEVLEDPYPGDTVRLRASVEGVAMRSATVEVDGASLVSDDGPGGGDGQSAGDGPTNEAALTNETGLTNQAGLTNEDGEITIAIPDDGTSSITVTISRGDFAGTATIDVLLLTATLEPNGLAIVPGTDATLLAELGDRPLPNAEVTVGNTAAGSTNDRGELAIELPADPRTQVTVTGEGQVATASVLGHYLTAWPLLALGLAAVSTGGVVAYRIRGLTGLGFVASFVVAIFAAVVADAVWGREGAVAVVALFTASVIAWLVRERADVARRGTAAGVGWLRRLRRRFCALAKRIRSIPGAITAGLVRLADWTTSAVDALVEALRRAGRTILGWLRRRPASVRGLLATLTRWWRRLTHRTVAAIRTRWRALIGGTFVLGTTVPIAYHVAGRRGVLALVTVLAIAAIASVFADRARSSDGSEFATAVDDRRAGTPVERTDTREEFSVTALWRAYARLVAPRSWRRKTAGEIGRLAIRRGFPPEAVGTLTDAFREVTYGGRRSTDSLRTRARRAYEAIRRDEPDRSNVGGGDRG